MTESTTPAQATREVATSSYISDMRTVGIKLLKNRLSEYLRLVAAGETILVTDRDRVVAELRPPPLAHPSLATVLKVKRARRALSQSLDSNAWPCAP